MKYQAVIRLAICIILTADLIGTVLCFALDSQDKALLNRQSDALTPQSEAETTKGEQWQEPSAPMFLGEKAEKYSLATLQTTVSPTRIYCMSRAMRQIASVFRFMTECSAPRFAITAQM